MSFRRLSRRKSFLSGLWFHLMSHSHWKILVQVFFRYIKRWVNYKRYTETEYNLSENVCGIENNRVKPAMRCANSFTFFFFFFCHFSKIIFYCAFCLLERLLWSQNKQFTFEESLHIKIPKNVCTDTLGPSANFNPIYTTEKVCQTIINIRNVPSSLPRRFFAK